MMSPRYGYVVLLPRALHPLTQFLVGHEPAVNVYTVFTSRRAAQAYADHFDGRTGLGCTVR